MKRKEISVWTYADTILSELSKGVLLTTQADNKVNTMTSSWGSLGREWGCPIFTTFVREGRFTREQLEKNGQFTVNIPYGTFQKKILGFLRKPQRARYRQDKRNGVNACSGRNDTGSGYQRTTAYT